MEISVPPADPPEFLLSYTYTETCLGFTKVLLLSFGYRLTLLWKRSIKTPRVTNVCALKASCSMERAHCQIIARQLMNYIHDVIPNENSCTCATSKPTCPRNERTRWKIVERWRSAPEDTHVGSGRGQLLTEVLLAWASPPSTPALLCRATERSPHAQALRMRDAKGLVVKLRRRIG